jgi:predicted RNA binding protein YcfA (HicA-like mRNA interferase family)
MSYNKKNDKYPALNCKEVVRALEKAGAELKRQKGGHAIYELHGRTIVVPVHGKKRFRLVHYFV